jgi:hypothetical protein
MTTAIPSRIHGHVRRWAALILLAGLAAAPLCQGADEPAEVAAPAWTVPPGWKKLDEQKAMRFATFRIGDQEADVIVSQFSGTVGGLLANVNRWRGQLRLEPLAEAQLADAVQPVAHPGFSGHTMRLKGADQHMLAAMIHDQQADRTWFIKLTAPPAVVDQHEAEFLAFARSLGQPAK